MTRKKTERTEDPEEGYEAGRDERGEVLDTVLKAHARSTSMLRPIHQKWRDDFDILRGLNYRMKKGQQRWRSDVRVPIARPYFDILVSRFFQAVPAAQAVGLDLQSRVNQDKMNMLLNRDQDNMRLESVFNPFVKDGIEKGLGVMRDGWLTETPDTVPHTKEFMERKLKSAKKTDPKATLKDLFKDEPTATWVDPFLCWWDPISYAVDMGGWWGETEYLSDGELMRHPVIDRAVAKEAVGSKVTVDQGVRDRLRSLGYGNTDVSNFLKNAKNGINEVLWYWGLYDVNDDGVDEECRLYVVNRVAAGKAEENPFEHGERPYSVWQYDAEGGSMVGFSFMDRMRSIQVEYDDATNHFADNRKLTMNPVITYRLGSDLDPEYLSYAPGLAIPVEQQDDVEYKEMPQFGNEIQSYLVALRELGQLLTGANDVTLGQQDVGIGDNTATGASIAQEQTEMRFKQPALMLDAAVIRFGNHLISNEQQFRDSDQKILVTQDGGVDFKDIAPRQISGNFDYQMASGTLMQDTGVQQFKKLQAFKQEVAQNPNFDLDKIDERIAEAMGINTAPLRKAPDNQNGDAANKLAQLPPDQRTAAVQQLKLAPEDEQLLMQHLAQNQNGQQPAPQPQGPVGPPPIPLQPAGMGHPGTTAQGAPGLPAQA